MTAERTKIVTTNDVDGATKAVGVTELNTKDRVLTAKTEEKAARSEWLRVA